MGVIGQGQNEVPLGKVHSIQDRLHFLELDAQAADILAHLRPSMPEILEESLSEFYARLETMPEMAKFFPNKEMMHTAQSRQLAHWQTILTGRFGPDYVQDVMRIGAVHAQRGIAPRWYIGGYALLLSGIFHKLIKREILAFYKQHKGLLGALVGPKEQEIEEAAEQLATQIAALARAALLDMDLSISIYLEKLQEEKARADEERSALEQIARAIDRLAAGDLEASLSADVAEKSPLLAKAFHNLKNGFGGIVSEIRQASGLVRESAASINKGSSSILYQSEEQVGSIRKITDATAALEMSISDVAEETGAAENAVRQCVVAATRGSTNIGHVQETMVEIRAAWNTISELVDTIQNIAAQTNFLALNANVEATRAAEMGRGFSVVATAIRDLSVKTTEAARQIASCARQSETMICNGDRAVNFMMSDLKEIGSGITIVSDAISKINVEMGKQEISVKETHGEAEALRDLTEKTSNMTRSTSLDCKDLTERSDKMVGLVSNFTLS
ncbi:protoglobin domain-containing protein [Acetobacter orientalis]|uniref:protoglobin domain-containing protein n=1 Tax=Acetobacter orientalis TaxID=146474 RepID=UPI0039EC00BE